MSETINFKKTKRKVSPLERIFSRSPYAIVTMVARIKGNVSKSMLKDAVKKVQKRHQNLRVRIKEEEDQLILEEWELVRTDTEINLGIYRKRK